MKIVKKVQSKYFKALLEGKKRFEIRLGDFRCKPGDILVLKEQSPRNNKPTNRKIECEVLYKLNIKDLEKFYSKKDIGKYGFVVLAVRKKFKFK